MKSAELLDQLVSGTHMQMVGVGQLHLSADLPEIIRGNRPLDGSNRTHTHKYRSLDLAVNGGHLRAFRPAIRCYNLIFHDYFSFLWVVMTYHNAPVMHTEE